MHNRFSDASHPLTHSSSTGPALGNIHHLGTELPLIHGGRDASLSALANSVLPGDERTISDYTLWLRQRGLSPATVESYLRTLRLLCRWLDAHYHIGPLQAGRVHLAQWRAQLDVVDDTVLSYMSFVRSFYRWATLSDRLHGPDPTIGVPVPRKRRRLPRPIADDAVEYAIDTAPERVRPWLILAAYAGLRCCEIASMHRDRYFDGAPTPFAIVIAKGGGERSVPLSPYVLGELAPLVPRRGYFFLRRDGMAGPVTRKIVSQLGNRHLHECGYVETMHQLRHRFGTLFQQQMGDIRVTQEALGHASVQSTQIYTDVASDAVARGMRLVQPKGRRLRAARRRAR